MSIFRPVPTAIWNDDTYLAMSPEQKLLFLYIHTSPAATQCGIYKISTRVGGFHLGFTHTPFDSALRGLCAAFPDLVAYDQHTNEIAILQHPKNVLTNASPKIWKQVAGELRNVKSQELLKLVIARNSATASAPYLQRLRQIQMEVINAGKNKNDFHGELYNPAENQVVTEEIEKEKEIEIEIEKYTPKKSPERATPKPHLIKDCCTDFDIFIGGDGLDWNTDKKEVVGVSKLITRLRDRLVKQGEIATDEKVRENFNLFLKMTKDLNDAWLNNHFTPAVLNSQFNNLLIRFRNGKSGNSKNNGGISADTVRETFEILFAEGGI